MMMIWKDNSFQMWLFQLSFLNFGEVQQYKSQPVRITVTPICSLTAKIKKHLGKKEKTA